MLLIHDECVQDGPAAQLSASNSQLDIYRGWKGFRVIRDHELNEL